MEAIVRGHATTVYEAIFDVELSEEQEEALDRKLDGTGQESGNKADLRSISSIEGLVTSPLLNAATRSHSRSVRERDGSVLGGQVELASGQSDTLRPPRRQQTIEVRLNPDSFEPEDDLFSKPISRLARLFGPRIAIPVPENMINNASEPSLLSEQTLAGVRRLEVILEDTRNQRDTSMQRLKEEIEDIQVTLQIILQFPGLFFLHRFDKGESRLYSFH